MYYRRDYFHLIARPKPDQLVSHQANHSPQNLYCTSPDDSINLPLYCLPGTTKMRLPSIWQATTELGGLHLLISNEVHH